MTDSAARTVQAEDESRTRALAAAIAGLAEAGDVIALKGELGSGKTVFARAFIAALGGLGEVPSPTFTLVQIYDLAAARVFHFDLYRLEKPEDALELDIDDAFADGISLIEWPEKLGGLLPGDHLLVALSYGETEMRRHCHVSGPESWTERLEEVSVES